MEYKTFNGVLTEEEWQHWGREMIRAPSLEEMGEMTWTLMNIGTRYLVKQTLIRQIVTQLDKMADYGRILDMERANRTPIKMVGVSDG